MHLKPLVLAAMVGGAVGFGGSHLLPSPKSDIETQAIGWLKAHQQRDREDEKMRQDFHKILNRLALMGCSRHMPKKEK